MADNLLPEEEERVQTSHYTDLKYPLLARGIPVPTALEDFIESLVARATLKDTEIEQIRKEMLSVFETNNEPVPPDFDKKFDSWFPRN